VDAVWPPTPDLRAAVARRLTVPAAPDIRPGVVRRIEDGPRGAAVRPRPSVRIARSLLLAAAIALVAAGLATALGFRLPGLEIRQVPSLPPAGAGLDLGSPIPIDNALARGAPHVLVPAALPRPDVAFERQAGDHDVLTLAWRADPGEATIPGSDLALSLLAVEGGTDDALVTKLVGPGTTVERVRVGGDPGWWISGAPHELLVRVPGGAIDTVRSSLAGDTLVFARDGTLYRLESALGRDRTIAIAESLR
jgi:hypothetical protein